MQDSHHSLLQRTRSKLIAELEDSGTVLLAGSLARPQPDADVFDVGDSSGNRDETDVLADLLHPRDNHL